VESLTETRRRTFAEEASVIACESAEVPEAIVHCYAFYGRLIGISSRKRMAGRIEPSGLDEEHRTHPRDLLKSRLTIALALSIGLAVFLKLTTGKIMARRPA
jgi:hypothetical protein